MDWGDDLIVTGALPGQDASLLALLGSLALNWPGHPPVRVHDLGLTAATVQLLRQAGVVVADVPPFCPHWRRHFAWKLWALRHAPARNVLWIEADCLVLRPLGEVLAAVRRNGYFFAASPEPLEWEASEAACAGCGVDPDSRRGRVSLASGLMGFRRDADAAGPLLEEALEVALVERHLLPTEITHRRSQALIALLAYKHFGEVLVADARVYHGDLWPTQVPGQKVWVHGNSLRAEDVAHLTAHLGTPGPAFVPTPPRTRARAQATAALTRVHTLFARGRRDEASARLGAAFDLDPTLKGDVFGLAWAFVGWARRLGTFDGHRGGAAELVPWLLRALARTEGPHFARMVSGQLSVIAPAESSSR